MLLEGQKMEKMYTTRPSLPPIDDYIERVRNIWESKWLTNIGEQHNEFESKLKAYLGVENLSLFVNGHMALEMAIQAMGLNGEVITTPYTFISTTHAIVRNGLKPVFCDIEGDSYTIDVNKLENLITDKTSAIIPVHVYGNICNVERIDEIARKYSLKVIYDAAHAFGVEYKGKSIAEYGDASMFSFHATKVFHSIEGGAVVYREKELGRRLYNLKNFGIRSEEIIEEIGANAKMNEFQAAMGICNLAYIDEAIKKRKDIVLYYYKCLEGCKGIRINREKKEVKGNYAYMPILVIPEEYKVSRDQLYGIFRANGIYVRKYFYPLTTNAECYKELYDDNNVPIAERVADNILTLPLYTDMTHEDVDRVCNIIWKTGQ